jgi:membrane protease YdiL (CAAX protease family)
MQTTIGQGLRGKENRLRLVAMATVAVVALGIDLWLSATGRSFRWDLRSVNAFSTLLLYAWIAPAAVQDLGLRVIPVQGFRYWFRVGGVLGAILLAIGLIAVAILLSGHLWRSPESVPTVAPAAFVSRFIFACIQSPIVEETLYRIILCVPIAAISSNLAIGVSGVLFAALHFVYGNPGPDNFLAGYLLAWAYLKSSAILVPVALHAGGNAIALGFQVAAWYVLHR